MQSIGETELSEEDLRLSCIYSLWQNGGDAYRSRFPESFAHVLHPDTSAEYLGNWILDFDTFFRTLKNAVPLEPIDYASLYSLALEFLEAGLIETLCKLSLLEAESRIDARHCALETLLSLAQCPRNSDHCNEIRSKIIKHGGLECLLKILESGASLWAHKSLAVSCLSEMFDSAHCVDSLAANQAAALISTCCRYHMESYYDTLKHAMNPQTRRLHAISARFFGTHDNTEEFENKLRMWLKKLKLLALEACMGVFYTRTNSISRQFSFQMIQNKPDIVASLLSIACEPIDLENTKRASDSVAAQILLNLMIFPPDIVLGLDTTMADDASNGDVGEFNAALQCNQILYSLPKALDSLIIMRNKIDGDHATKWRSYIVKAISDSKNKSMDQAFLSDKFFYPNQVTILLISLRLMINLTYLATPHPLLLLTLLPLSYTSCTRVPMIERNDLLEETGNLDDWIDGGIRRKRGWRELILGEDSPTPNIVTCSAAPEPLLGPILLFRSLLRLSQAGYGLDELRRLKALPDDVPLDQGSPVHLVHIHQILEPKLMGKLIRMSVSRRVSDRRELGKERLLQETRPKGDRYLAISTFTSAAELALAVNAFGSHPSNSHTRTIQSNWNSITQAKQEIVLCLGNAAEAAGRVGEWKMAKEYAKNAIDFSEITPPKDAAAIGWDIASAQGKNARRLSTALERLKELR